MVDIAEIQDDEVKIVYKGLSHGNKLFTKEWEKEGFIERISVFTEKMKGIIRSCSDVVDNVSQACITLHRKDC